MKFEKKSTMKLIYVLLLIILTLLFIYAIIKAQFSNKVYTAEETLVLTNVVFRHGDRSPEKATSYPNCPHNDSHFFPYHFGEVTLKGQGRMIRLGAELKQRYGTFLGDIFFTDLVKSYTSGYARTEMSLQALHAGLFWTNKQNVFPGFSWQAIPYVINPQPDKIICIWTYHTHFFNSSLLPPAKNKETQDVFDYLLPFTGYPIFGYIEALFLFDYIKTAADFGYEPPDWITKVYPYPLRRIALDSWRYIIQVWMKKGGLTLLRKITNNAVAKSKGTLLPATRKMFLYAVHDVNIHFILAALNVWFPEEVKYGAHVLFELHKIDEVYGFKIYYNNFYKTYRLLRVPGCSDFCALDRFINLTKKSYSDEG